MKAKPKPSEKAAERAEAQASALYIASGKSNTARTRRAKLLKPGKAD